MSPHVRRVTPQPYLPIGRARGRGGLFPLGRLHGRSCYLDMKTPPRAGQASPRRLFGRNQGLNYSAALRNGVVPERNCSRSEASSALATTRCRCFTGP
jgi:hypothetical protein